MKINKKKLSGIHGVLFYLLLALLPTQLGYHFWPSWAHVLGRRVDYLSPTVYATDVLIGLIIGCWFIERYKSIKGPVSSINTKYLLPIFCFIAFNIIYAVSPWVAVYKWLKVLEFGLLAWYIVKTKPRFSLVALFLSVGIFYSSLIAIAQFVFQHSIGGIFWWLGERTFSPDTPGIARADFHFSLFTFHFSLFKLRPYATFPHPNVLGGYIATVLPMVIWQIRHIRPIRQMGFIWEELFLWSSVFLGITALVLTFSRGAWVAGGIAIACAIARSMNYELRIKRYMRIFVVLSILVLFVASRFMIHNSSSESVVVRQELNTAAVKIWQQSPIVGVGLGNFLVKLPEFLPKKSVYFLQPVHNIYLLILAETGIIGLLFFFWIIQKGLGVSINTIPIILLLLLGLVDHYPLTLQQGQLLLALAIGLAIAGMVRKSCS